MTNGNFFDNLDIEDDSSSDNKIRIYNLIILDKSGSMETVKDVTINGLNEQLQSIRKSQKDYPEQEQIVCFSTFNDKVDCDLKWRVPISEIKDFVSSDYYPNGMTALHDAIGISISKLRKEISKELSNRTSNIMICIFTDGEENCSKEFSNSQAKELIEDVKKSGLWTVSFIGCGENVFEVAHSYGIKKGDTLQYDLGIEGTHSAFSCLASKRYEKSANYSKTYSSIIDKDVLDEEINKISNIDNFFDDEK